MRGVDKLQWKLIPVAQLLGYGSLMLIGSIIIMLSVQLYLDIKPYFESDAGILGNRSLVVTKKISLFKTADKSGIYFSDEEIQQIKEQDFVEDIATFSTANFEVKGFFGQGQDIPNFKTDFFMEGIPEKYLDVQTDKWQWNPSDSLVPVIIPRSYLQLYNFGFAETKNLPVISENMLSQVTFGLQVGSYGDRRKFKGQIVGFSDKLNSILVPDRFIQWGNTNYGSVEQQKPNRLLVSLSSMDDKSISDFFQSRNYEIDREALEQNKIWFFLQGVFLFLLIVACIIIVLSCLAMLMGVNLMFHKHRDTFNNLALLGYSNSRMTRYYQLFILGFIAVICCIAAAVTTYCRSEIREEVISIYRLDLGSQIGIIALILFTVLAIWNSSFIHRKIYSLNKSVR